jgi:hypothetical protein
MKKLVLLMLLVSGLGFCQKKVFNSKPIKSGVYKESVSEKGADGTTEKEFAYISKGYQEDALSGRDIINGYEVELISSNATLVTENRLSVSRSTLVYRLIRKETKETAAFMIKNVRKDNGTTEIFCLPNANSDNSIWTKARDIYLASSEAKKCDLAGANFAYNWNVLMMFSELMTNR